MLFLQLFHEYNIPVVVDGAHALGNMAVDLQKMGNPGKAASIYIMQRSI